MNALQGEAECFGVGKMDEVMRRVEHPVPYTILHTPAQRGNVSVAEQ